MKKQSYFGLSGHGEKLPFNGYINDDGVFAIRLDKGSPAYQRWKIDHLPSGYLASYAPTRKEATQIVKEATQVAKENSINLNFSNINEISFEHKLILKKAFRR